MKTDPLFRDNLNLVKVNGGGFLICPGSPELTAGCPTVELARVDQPTYWNAATNEEMDHTGFLASGGGTSDHMETVRIHFLCAEHGDFGMVIHGFATASEGHSGSVMVMTEGP